MKTYCSDEFGTCTENYKIILPLLEDSLKRAWHLTGTVKLPSVLTMVLSDIFTMYLKPVVKSRQRNRPGEIKMAVVNGIKILPRLEEAVWRSPFA